MATETERDTGRWNCEDCRIWQVSKDEAIRHAEEEDHWLTDGSERMHASDYGGVYIDPVGFPYSVSSSPPASTRGERT